MNAKTIFTGIATLLSLVCAFIAIAYLLEYFFQFNEIITPIQSLILQLKPIESFLSSFGTSSITFQGKVYSNDYLVCMIFFLVLAFVVHNSTFFIESICDFLENTSRIEKVKKDKGYSIAVKKKFANASKKENAFYIAFLLNIKENAYVEKLELATINAMKTSIYNSFIPIFKKYDFVKVMVKSDRIYIISEDFSKFDEVFIEFMRRVQSITKQNIVSHIQTTAYFILDVIEGEIFTDKNEKFVDKILKYDYKNQVIVTSFLAEKYSNEVDGKFQANSIGTVRIYLNELIDTRDIDIFADEVPQSNDYEDYELHVLKRKAPSTKK